MRSPLVTVVALISTCSFGQQLTPSAPLEFVQWEVQKRKVMMSILDIPQSQAAKFWQVYEEYESVRRSLMKDRVKILLQLESATSSMKVRKYARKLLLNDLDYSRICHSFFTQLKHVCSRADASEFILAEKYFQALFIQQLAPFTSDHSVSTQLNMRKTILPDQHGNIYQ